MSTPLTYNTILASYYIKSFFCVVGGDVWAIGYPVTGATRYDYDATKLTILKSSNNFDTYSIVKQWNGLPNDQYSHQLTAPWPSLYIDEYGNIYVGTSPNVLYSKDGGSTWNLLPGVDFTLGGSYSQGAPGSLTAYPNWVWSEDLSTHTMYISNYGKGHLLYKSVGSNRDVWTYQDFTNPAGNGYYYHIHFYSVNPYNNAIHLISCGDPEDKGIDPAPPGGFVYPAGADLYVSTDHGVTWNKGLFNHDPLTGAVDYYFGDFSNAPCMTTWLPDGSAFITTDDAGRNMYVRLGANGNWDRSGMATPATAQDFGRYLFPATTWDGVAVAESYITYLTILGSVYYDPDLDADVEQPTGLFKYNIQTGEKSEGIFWGLEYDTRSYIGNGVGNVIPGESAYIFSNHLGGIRVLVQAGGTFAVDTPVVAATVSNVALFRNLIPGNITTTPTCANLVLDQAGGQLAIADAVSVPSSSSLIILVQAGGTFAVDAPVVAATISNVALIGNLGLSSLTINPIWSSLALDQAGGQLAISDMALVTACDNLMMVLAAGQLTITDVIIAPSISSLVVLIQGTANFIVADIGVTATINNISMESGLDSLFTVAPIRGQPNLDNSVLHNNHARIVCTISGGEALIYNLSGQRWTGQ